MIAKYKYMEIINREFDVSHEQIISRSRKQILKDVRLVLWWALREGGYSYPAIGKYTGRDHSTILRLLNMYSGKYQEKGKIINEILTKGIEYKNLADFEVKTIKIPDYSQDKIIEIQRVIKKV